MSTATHDKTLESVLIDELGNIYRYGSSARARIAKLLAASREEARSADEALTETAISGAPAPRDSDDDETGPRR